MILAILQLQSKKVVIVADQKERYLLASLTEFRAQHSIVVNATILSKEECDEWNSQSYFALLMPYYSCSAIALEGVDCILYVHPPWDTTQMVQEDRSIASIVRGSKNIPVLRLFAPRCLLEKNFCRRVSENDAGALHDLSALLAAELNDDIHALKALFAGEIPRVIEEESFVDASNIAQKILAEPHELPIDTFVGDIYKRKIFI